LGRMVSHISSERDQEGKTERRPRTLQKRLEFLGKFRGIKLGTKNTTPFTNTGPNPGAQNEGGGEVPKWKKIKDVHQ